MIRGLEHLACEERLRELRLFSCRSEGSGETLEATFQHLKGACKKTGVETE